MDEMTAMRKKAMDAIDEAERTGGKEAEEKMSAIVKKDFDTLTSYKAKPQVNQVAP